MNDPLQKFTVNLGGRGEGGGGGRILRGYGNTNMQCCMLMQVHLLPIPNQVLTSLPVPLRWLLAHLVNVLSCDFTHSCSE